MKSAYDSVYGQWLIFILPIPRLDKLIEFVKKKYVAILNTSNIENTSFWTSEMAPNEFTVLPVFQDKNLLVQITFYNNEFEYQAKMKDVAAKMNDA